MLSVIFILIALYLLILGADKFIDGASQVATYLKMSPLIVGIVIVGFGTSAPEIAVSIMASLEHKGALAIGNAYGSNIANIALILGVIASLATVKINKEVRRKELPLLLGITILSVLLLLDFDLNRIDGAILAVCFVLIMLRTIYNSRKGVETQLEDNPKKVRKRDWARTIFNLIFGLILLIFSSKLLVYGASDLASRLGVSDFIIGLTVVAVGTSLPELATCVASIRKKEHDMALGNIIGSNMFNSLAVVSISVIIHPVHLSETIIFRDISVMLALTFILFLFALIQGKLNRLHSVIFLLIYICYISYIASTTTA